MVAAPRPRWRRRKEARPSEIIEAALASFSEKGFAATRLDDIAARAGVTRGTLYLYFPSKEELFKEVVRQSLLPALKARERMMARSDITVADIPWAAGAPHPIPRSRSRSSRRRRPSAD